MAKFNPEEWEARVKREIAEEEAQQAGRDRKMDDAFMGDAFYLLGVNPSELIEFRKQADKDSGGLVNADEAMRVIKRGQKEYKKGNKAKAKKILNSNKDAKKIAAAAKKKKSCLVVAIMMLTVGGSTIGAAIYGAVQAVASVLP